MAGTGEDHHDRPLAGFTTGTPEVHQDSLGSVGGTASAIYAGATIARLVGLNTGTILIGEVYGFLTPHHPLALTASLQGDKDPFT